MLVIHAINERVDSGRTRLQARCGTLAI